MEKEKKISTFTANEKETMEKMDKFESSMKESLAEGERISSIEYYEKLKIKDGLEINSDIYIAKITNDDGTEKVGIYAKDSNNLLGYVNEEGHIEFIDPLLRSLEIEMTLEDLKELNIENIRAKSEELTPEELEEYIEKQKKGEGKEEKDEKEDKDSEEKDEQEANEELMENEGQDLGITYYKKIKDPRLQLEFPELKGKKLGLAYSSKLGQYIITEKDENGIRIADEIKPAKPTMRSVISIGENGENVERKSPHALMKTNRKDIEMSITIDIYGYIELGKVRVTPCNERVERPVKVQSKTNVPETEVIKATDTRTENHEIAHNFEKGEEKGIEIQNLNMIIDLGNGETTTIAKEAEKAKVSPEEFLNLYNEAEGKTPKEKIDNAHEEVEEQFRGNERRR